MVVFGGRGGRGNEGRVQVDGLNTGASLNGGGVSGYRQDTENAAEIAMTTAGGLGETEVGGPTMNIVPADRRQHASRSHFFVTGLKGGMQSHNFTDGTPTPPGCARPTETNYIYDTSFSSGGPIIKDRLWYLRRWRTTAAAATTSRMFHNINAGDITKWTYVADTSRPAAERRATQRPAAAEPAFDVPAHAAQQAESVLGRADQQRQHRPGIRDHRRLKPAVWNHGFQRVQQAKWTSTTTSQLLLEAGVGTYLSTGTRARRRATIATSFR